MAKIKNVIENYNIRGKNIKVKSKQKFDRNGKPVFDERLDDEAIDKAFNIYRKYNNIIDPKKIISLRKFYGISQRDFAALLGWSPTTLVNYENGALPSSSGNNILLLLLKDKYLARDFFEATKSHISSYGRTKLIKLFNSNAFTHTTSLLNDFIKENYAPVNGSIYTGYMKFNFDKLVNVILYYVNKLSNVSKTKLCKLLFYTDFLTFALQTKSMTGTPYVKLQYGPVPDEFSTLYTLLIRHKVVTTKKKIKGNYEWPYYIPYKNKKPDISIFNKLEISILKYLSNLFKDYSASDISKASHKEIGWIKSKYYKNISYNYSTRLTVLNDFINRYLN